MKTIDFVYFDAGGGHRSAATALSLVIERQARPWQPRLVNLQELLDPLDFIRKLTGIRMQDVYNGVLRKGWTLGTPQLLRVMHLVIRLYHSACVRVLQDHWRQSRPDLAVSLIPHFNGALGQSVAQELPGTPFVTILTDLADYPPHFWIERQQQFLICGTERAAAQALALGHSPTHILRTSGMILHPRFYDKAPLDRGAERRRLGLRPDLLTGVVLFGGQGSDSMLEIAGQLERYHQVLQLIFLCGRNQNVAERLRRRVGRLLRFVEGFTTEVPYYMRLADFFIGKPGPGSISEALAMQLPVIVERNAWTLPQERYNTEWVLGNQVGLVVRSFREVAAAVEHFLQPEQFARYRAAAAAIENQAVFEVPDLLDQILQRNSRTISNQHATAAALQLPLLTNSPELIH